MFIANNRSFKNLNLQKFDEEIDKKMCDIYCLKSKIDLGKIDPLSFTLNK